MAVLRSHHIHVTSRNVQESADFYTNVLGARLIDEQDGDIGKVIDVDLGGMPIRISGATGVDGSWPNAYGLHHLGLQVDDIDEFAAAAKAGGVEFVVGPSATSTGSKTAFVKGPDNTLFEISQPGA